MWTETFTNGSSCREACKTSSVTQFSLGNDVPSRDPGGPGVKHFPSLFFWMIRVITPVVVAAMLNRMNLSSWMAGMWACEEFGFNGLHYCWICCQSHLGVFGGVEYREFWGNATSILSEAKTVCANFVNSVCHGYISSSVVKHWLLAYAGNLASCNSQFNKDFCEWALGGNSSWSWVACAHTSSAATTGLSLDHYDLAFLLKTPFSPDEVDQWSAGGK